MATIINTPGTNTESSAVAGWTVAIVAIILLGLVGLFVWNAERTPEEGTATTPPPQQESGGLLGGPSTVNNYTTINATSTINNSTTTR